MKLASGSAFVSVVVPCLNEELTIAKVVTDHLKALPGARQGYP